MFSDERSSRSNVANNEEASVAGKVAMFSQEFERVVSDFVKELKRVQRANKT